MNETDKTERFVIPALSRNPEFGVQSTPYNWIPASAGMTIPGRFRSNINGHGLTPFIILFSVSSVLSVA